jgi:hypothetical protein
MALVVVTTTIRNETKYLIGKESRFLRDAYPEVRDMERYIFPGNYVGYYTRVCKKLSRKYGMRIQFDTPDLHPNYTRTRYRYLRSDWRYGVVKGAFESSKDMNSLDNAIREFNEEVMDFDDRDAFEDMKVRLFDRDVFRLHLEDSTDLCKAIAHRTNSYYGELFEMELMSWEEIQNIWRNLNVVSKSALEFVYSSTQ